MFCQLAKKPCIVGKWFKSNQYQYNHYVLSYDKNGTAANLVPFLGSHLPPNYNKKAPGYPGAFCFETKPAIKQATANRCNS